MLTLPGRTPPILVESQALSESQVDAVESRL